MADQKPRDQRSDLQSPAAPQQSPGYPQNFQPIIFDGFEGLNTKPTRPAIEDQQCFWLDNWMPLGKSNLRTLYDIGAPIFLAPIAATTWNPSDKTNIDLSNVNLTADAVAGIAAPAPTGYTTGAVHFNGTTWLSTAALVSTDNAFISFVGWFKCALVDVPSLTLYVSDPAGAYTAFALGSVNAVTNAGIDWEASNLAGTKTLDTNNGGINGFPAAQWNCFIGTLDTAGSTGVLYNKDTNVTNTFNAVGGAFTNALNGAAFFVGGDGSGGATVDMADFRLMPGTSLITAGDIPQVTRRLFIDAAGKPVDPATATAALGAPCILFSKTSAAAASTFATNLGTGGAFTTTGALTNASTSPSD